MDKITTQVKSLLQNGEGDQAHQLITEYLQNDLDKSDEINAHILKYNILMSLGQYNETIDQVESLILQSEDIPLVKLSEMLYFKSTAQMTLGEYDNAWSTLYPVLKGLKNQNDRSEDYYQIMGNILNRLGTIKINTGDFEEGTNFIVESLNYRRKLENQSAIAQTLYNLGTTHFQIGKLEKATQYLRETKSIYKRMGNKRGIAFCKMELGGIYEKQGKLDQALEYFIDANKLFEELGNGQQIAWSLTDLGNIYQALGEISKSLEYYKRGLSYYEEFDDIRTTANHKRAMAKSYRLQGKYEKSLELNTQALKMYKEISNRSFEGRALRELGKDHHAINELDTALKYYNQTIQIFEEEDNTEQLGRIYYYIILLHLDREEVSKADDYLSKLTLIVKQTESELLAQAKELVEGMILEKKDRLIEMGKAQEKFRKIVSMEVNHIEITTKAAFVLANSLVAEFEMIKQPEILDELFEHTVFLEQLARSQNSPPLKIESLIIQSKLKLFRANLDEAKSLLSEAYNISSKKGYEFLSKKATKQIDDLIEHEEELRELFQQEQFSTDQILEISGLRKYVFNLIGQTQTNLGISQEQPIYLTIINKGGSSIFAKNFANVRIDDQLISGFLTAVSSFARETFTSTGQDHLDQIKIGENTVSIHRRNNFAFCYVYKGSSYFALAKLKTLVDELYKSPQYQDLLNQAEASKQAITDKDFEQTVEVAIRD